MNYKYEFERLLLVAKQAMRAIDLDKKKVLSLAELVVLRNAIIHYDSAKEQGAAPDSEGRCPCNLL